MRKASQWRRVCFRVYGLLWCDKLWLDLIFSLFAREISGAGS